LLKALGKEQLSIFSDYLVSAADPTHWHDGVLVLVGDPTTGYVIRKIITDVIGGRSIDAESWLTGAKYNTQMLGKEHLVYNGPITRKMAKTLRYEFVDFKRKAKIPPPGQFFEVDLWQRITIVTQDEDSLKHLRDNPGKYVVLKLMPLEEEDYITQEQLNEEQDFFIDELRRKPTTWAKPYWYDAAENASKSVGPRLEDLVIELPADWEWTTTQFLDKTGYRKSERQFKKVEGAVGKELNALVAKELLSSRVLHGKTGLPKKGGAETDKRWRRNHAKSRCSRGMIIRKVE
jgi:hypothetical protein